MLHYIIYYINVQFSTKKVMGYAEKQKSMGHIQEKKFTEPGHSAVTARDASIFYFE